MFVFNAPIEQIVEDDLQQLLDDKVIESKTVEYKATLYRIDGLTKSQRKTLSVEEKDKSQFSRNKQIVELLKDVSAFANTIGGYLLLGIREEDGVPVEVCGVQCDDPDANRRQMIHLIDQWVEPRLEYGIHPVLLSTGRYVFVIHVQDSTLSPHRVTHGDHGHFYSRNSDGAGRMDTMDLRQAFTISETGSGEISLNWLSAFMRGLQDVFPELKSAINASDVRSGCEAGDVFEFVTAKAGRGENWGRLIELQFEMFVHPTDFPLNGDEQSEDVGQKLDWKLPPTTQEIWKLQSKLRQELCRAHDRRERSVSG